MLNHYSRPNRTLLRLLSVVFPVFFIALFVSCNKSSNQLKPFYNNLTFSKTIDYNGSTILLVDIEQKMYVGTDSLIITIHNPGPTAFSGELLIFVQKADEFDQTLDYNYIIPLNQLESQGDTKVVFNNYDLPLEASEIQVGLLSKATGTNPISGVYSGLVGYLYGSDTTANTYSFGKGVIYADGKFNFWMKLGSTNKKLSGQFIDMISMNSIYQASTELTAINSQLDTLPDGSKFDTLSNQLLFRVQLQGQPSNSENKLWFNLHK